MGVFTWFVRKRQQMPSSPFHIKVDLSHHSNFHENKKRLQKLSSVFSKNAFKWLLLSFLLVWLVGIALFASSNSTASDIQGNQVEFNTSRQFDFQTEFEQRFEKMKVMSIDQKKILEEINVNLINLKMNK